jgi:outer membrane protein TolC
MIRRLFTLMSLLALWPIAPAAGQTPLTLPEAIARARSQNLDALAAAAAEREAGARVTQARGSHLPTVALAESWQRGNQPVFVFGSLLGQRQFTAANFAIDALNRPDAVNNFRTALTVEQALFDPATAASLEYARLGREMAAAGRTSIDQDLAVSVTDAYGRVLVAAASLRTATAALGTAEADRQLAGSRRDAGLATDADVLQVEVYLARVREQQIRAASDERVARARLNQLMGEPLDAAFALDPAPEAGAVAGGDMETLEGEALANRPDVTIAVLQERQAAASRDIARAAFLPRIGAQAGWETNGGRWDSRSTSWVVGAVAQVNLFRGFADQARVAEARELLARRRLEREKAETAARLDVRIAFERLEEARAREATGRAAADQARESRRIVRDRYESGVTDVVSLLRAAEAVQEAEARQIAAQVDLVLAGAAITRALGRR